MTEVPDLTSSPGGAGGAARARLGTAMARTRGSILGGAQRCVLHYGSRKTTMGDIAAEAGVAKATLYNHFRAKAEVYAALAESEVLAAEERVRQAVDRPACDQPGRLAAALAEAGRCVAEHPVLRRLAEHEPAVLAGLLTPSAAPVWGQLRRTVADLLGPAHDLGAADAVLCWLVGCALSQPAATVTADGARLLAVGLDVTGEPGRAPEPPVAEPPAAGRPAPSGVPEAPTGTPDRAAGLGWPSCP